MILNSIYPFGQDVGQAKPEYSNQPITVVIKYVEQYLPLFSSQNKQSLNPKNERGLTQNLVRLLNSNLNDTYPFFFDKEGIQNPTRGNSPSVDIDVIAKDSITVDFRIFTSQQPFFAFEAKVLGVEKKHRYREYVVGYDQNNSPKPNGGIERFKKGIHCKELSHVAMLGYILEENFGYWHSEVNKWIDNLIHNSSNNGFWSEDDKLISEESQNENISNYRSKSNRYYNNEERKPILINHFWINLV